MPLPFCRSNACAYVLKLTEVSLYIVLLKIYTSQNNKPPHLVVGSQMNPHCMEILF